MVGWTPRTPTFGLFGLNAVQMSDNRNSAVLGVQSVLTPAARFEERGRLARSQAGPHDGAASDQT